MKGKENKIDYLFTGIPTGYIALLDGNCLKLFKIVFIMVLTFFRLYGTIFKKRQIMSQNNDFDKEN